MTTALDAAFAWRLRAACRGADPELFWPRTLPEARVTARRYCRGCPVVESCRQAADLRHEEGLWGGEWRYRRGERLGSYTVRSLLTSPAQAAG